MDKLANSYKTKSQQELLEYYDNWDTYEQDIMSAGYMGPVGCTALLYKYIDKSKKILEVGCGPGNVAKYLNLMNFTYIDGIDGSKGMVKRAIESKVYNNVYHHIIKDDKLPVDDFDVLLAMGVFTIGHFPKGSMKTCFDSIKRGGYFCFSGTKKVLESYFKDEFEYVKLNSTFVDCTEPYLLAVSNSSTEKNTATVFLFRKNLAATLVENII